MSLATSNRDGGKTSESGHLRALMKGFKAQVLTGLNVSQRAAGANMSVDLAIGDAIIPRSDGTYGHPAWNDAVLNKTITTADVSNPRRDIVVLYIDYGQAPSTAVSNNTNGVVKCIVVAGTPAGSPTDPSGATIQSAVGSGNPYIKLARVRVGAGVTTISNSVIDDLRLLATGLEQGGWQYDDLYTWVYASATTFTIAGVDVTSQFPIGTRILVRQGGALKYFVVTGSSFSTNTTVTVSGGNTYTLANVPIDTPAFSYDMSPVGYPRTLVPSDPLDTYSTSEQLTGKFWTDGRPIYRKVIRSSVTLSTTTTSNVAHGISGLTSAFELVSFTQGLKIGSGGTNNGTQSTVVHREFGGNWAWITAVDTTNISVSSSFNWGASFFTAVLEYVK